mgnify:CR=1 FL=1
MITTKFLPVLILSTALAGGSAIAQTSDETPSQANPNQAIEQQIEAETSAGTVQPEKNTLGEAAATAQTNEPIGSGAAIEWVGKPIAAIDGTKVGTVSEVMIDQTGAVTEVRAKVGGLFGLFTREVAIPAARIILEQNGTLVAEMSADEIKKAPTVSG